MRIFFPHVSVLRANSYIFFSSHGRGTKLKRYFERRQVNQNQSRILNIIIYIEFPNYGNNRHRTSRQLTNVYRTGVELYRPKKCRSEEADTCTSPHTRTRSLTRIPQTTPRPDNNTLRHHAPRSAILQLLLSFLDHRLLSSFLAAAAKYPL